MAYFDLPLDQLTAYRPELRAPDDLARFWRDTLAQARQHDVDVTLDPVSTGLRTVQVYDVTFRGFAGDPVKGWFVRPANDEVVPTVVEFVGYGGGRGLPHERLAWASAGYGHLVMDSRGQGSGWGTGGGTSDPHGSGPHRPGFMTMGIEAPEHHYYRRLYTDGVRAVDAARAIPGVDPEAIAVTGVSQGGGTTLAVAGLADDLVAVMPDVPFMCQIDRAITITDAYPYREVVDYLHVHRHAEQRVLDTLAYLDAASIARSASAPALFSVSLMDQTCPPSTVYAAFNHYGHPEGSEIDVFRYNGHEGGEGYRWPRQLAFLERVLRASSRG